MSPVNEAILSFFFFLKAYHVMRPEVISTVATKPIKQSEDI